jgi:lipopolysaccharide biosynthesis glycosyltransferase
LSGKIKESQGLNANEPYCNAGVLYVNLDFWRSNEGSQKICMEYLSAKSKNFQDQMAINRAFRGKIKLLPLRYNMISHIREFSAKSLLRLSAPGPFYTEQEINEAKQNPAIIHFTADFLGRPWLADCKVAAASLWDAALEKTPWAGTPKLAWKKSKDIQISRFLYLHVSEIACLAWHQLHTKLSLAWHQLRGK